MILSALFHFLRKIFGAVIRFIAWLLVALSLWVPLVYALIFVIMCGITGASITALQPWFFGGLAVAFIVSFVISTVVYERRIAKKKREKTTVTGNLEKVKEKSVESSIKKRADGTGATDEPPYEEDFAGDSGSVPAEDRPDKPVSALERLKSMGDTSQYPGMQGGKKEPRLSTGDTASKHNFYSYNDINNTGERNPADYRPVSDTPLEGGTGYPGYGVGFDSGYKDDNFGVLGRAGQDYGRFDSRLSDDGMDFGRGTDKSFSSGGHDYDDEQPRIFATRNDPTVLIYEYSDRLEYYKRTREGLIRFKTQTRLAP
jgi:membrane protein implicated in regulation of membrane protease activity